MNPEPPLGKQHDFDEANKMLLTCIIHRRNYFLFYNRRRGLSCHDVSHLMQNESQVGLSKAESSLRV